MINKKGAIELSMTTIVVLVIAMAMLILGLVLVKTIFTGAKYNVDQLNKNVEAEINKLFSDTTEKIAVYLPNKQAEVSKGKTFGVAFGVKNTEQLSVTNSQFKVEVITDAGGIERGCTITPAQANNFVSLIEGGTSFQIIPGDVHYGAVHFRIPDTSPLCQISYTIKITKDNQIYTTDFFNIQITG
ncbi:MAG: hypothetical protein AABX66_01835 [Nanoarchaeota archaeon]